MGSAFKFFVLTCLATWSCWIPAVIIADPSKPDSPLVSTLVLLGTFAPAVVALTLIAHSAGRLGLISLLSRLLPASGSFRWYLFAILYMPVEKGAVALSYFLASGKWPGFGHEGPFVIAAAIILSTPVQAGEELGWRGYALPGLAARYGFGPASILVGLVWGIWHLPLFFLPGTDKYRQSFPLYVVGVVAFSIAIAWLYANTQGNLLLTMLMHSAFNQTIGIVPDIVRQGKKPFAFGASLSFLLTIGWMWIAAGYFLVRMRLWTSTRRRTELAPDQVS